MLTPPAPAGVEEKSSSPIDELPTTALWWMFTLSLKQNGRLRFWILLVSHEVGYDRIVWPRPPSATSGCSPVPIVMPPDIVPALLLTRLLASCRLCVYAC